MTTTIEQLQTDAEKLAEIQRRQQFLRKLHNPTLGDLYNLGIFSFSGRLSNPRGAWHCPDCWFDYCLRGQYREVFA